jgi:N-acetylneuraminic acid mutarotase
MNKNFATMLVLIFLLASCIIVAKPVFSYAGAAEGSWVSKAPLPLPSWGIVGLNGKIYAIAGSGDYANVSYVNNAVLEYDPALDTWTVKKPLPTPRGSFATAAYQNKIYCIGGAGGLNQIYDPQKDTWETKTPMPTPRTQLDANVVNGKIYLVGGTIEGGTPTNLNEVYDPTTDSWTTKAAMPTGVYAYASAVVDNKIHFIGGSDPKPPNLNQIYDPATDTWSLGTPIPTPVVSAEAGATTGKWAPKRIYVIGGRVNYGMDGTSINQVYNPENDSWTDGASMPTARFQLHVTVVDDKVYAMGGLPYFNVQGDYSYENEQYTPIGYKLRVTVLSPENKTYDATAIPLNFTVNEEATSTSYSSDGQEKVTITGNITLEGLSSGSHNLTVYAEDAAGNSGVSETIYFSIKVPFPTTWVVAAIAIAITGGSAFAIYYLKKPKRKGNDSQHNQTKP